MEGDQPRTTKYPTPDVAARSAYFTDPETTEDRYRDEGRELADELIQWARYLHIALPQSLYDRARRLIGELPSQEPTHAE